MTTPTVDQPWHAITTGYAYTLLEPNNRAIISYHWHQTDRSPITFPHLHVSGQSDSLNIAKLHLPTDVISLATIVRLAITELDIPPLRANWREILDLADEHPV